VLIVLNGNHCLPGDTGYEHRIDALRAALQVIKHPNVGPTEKVLERRPELVE
jgi:hypothetical protein